MTAIERLEQLLDEKDSELALLRTQLDEFKEAQQMDWSWARHTTLEKDHNDTMLGLPIPRLELRVCRQSKDSWHNWQWDYNLVLRHLLGHVVIVPLGRTTVNGGTNRPPLFQPTNELNLPFRDGAHIQHDRIALNLPAFAICEDTVVQLLDKGQQRIK